MRLVEGIQTRAAGAGALSGIHRLGIGLDHLVLAAIDARILNDELLALVGDDEGRAVLWAKEGPAVVALVGLIIRDAAAGPVRAARHQGVTEAVRGGCRGTRTRGQSTRRRRPSRASS